MKIFRTDSHSNIPLVSMWLCCLFVYVQSTWAQDIITYSFMGNVKSLNPGSTAFAGVEIGTPVEGQFTIDYGAFDSAPEFRVGDYLSSQVGFSGRIGSHAFASEASPFNRITVDDADPLFVRGDFLVFSVKPGTPSGSSRMELTFHDATQQAITGDALPSSAMALAAFPDFALFVMTPSGFGHYAFDVTITPVPEPSSRVLLATAGVVFVAWRWRWRKYCQRKLPRQR